MNKTDQMLLFDEASHALLQQEKYRSLPPEELFLIQRAFIEASDDTALLNILKKMRQYHFETFIHSFDVFFLFYMFLSKCGQENMNKHALRGALLHDAGKLFIPLSILDKSAKLTDAEYETMKSHTTQGFFYLVSEGFVEEAIFARDHHERCDGSGYPFHNKNIPKEMQVFGLLDVLSALTMDRIYKPAFTLKESFSIIEKNQESYDLSHIRMVKEMLGVAVLQKDPY